MIRRLRFLIALTMLVVIGAATATTASAGGRKVFDAQLTGIPTAGLALFGVTGGGVPWVIDEGQATLTADGQLNVEVEGLVLATTHVNPVATGRAIVACAGVVAASTGAVPFSSTGDAEVHTTVSLPSPCLAPAVFFAGITGGGDRWFAVTGF